ncbi:MAG: hypothetical protein HY675_25790 [Chloroflexi bacterium]|nr:hypothetical protein [Chloroflexota bacterium]
MTTTSLLEHFFGYLGGLLDDVVVGLLAIGAVVCLAGAAVASAGLGAVGAAAGLVEAVVAGGCAAGAQAAMMSKPRIDTSVPTIARMMLALRWT